MTLRLSLQLDDRTKMRLEDLRILDRFEEELVLLLMRERGPKALEEALERAFAGALASLILECGREG